jgi:hypothetical protein
MANNENERYIDERSDSDINNIFSNSNSIINSWADLVNNEMGNSIVEKQMSSIIENEEDEDEDEQKRDIHLNVGEIMALDITQLTETQIMQYQNYITSQLRKYFKQCLDKDENIDYELHLPRIHWIGEVSKYFSNKYNLKCTFHRVKMTVDSKSIPRSSYKFCEYGSECTYNYNSNTKEKCHSQHFVHNLIYADIISLYQYLLIGQTTNKKLDMIDVLKSMNTISFVINHMYEEMSLLSLYNPNKTMQLNKNIKKVQNKNNKKQKNKSLINVS